MSRTNQRGDADAPNTRELLDAYFDGELDRADAPRLRRALREDPVLAEEFGRTSEAVSMLSQSGANSALDVDLSERVLARCEATRGYLNKRGRRFVLAGRSAVALTALAMVAGVVLWVRLTPPELRLPDSQRPLGVLLESGTTDAAKLRMVPPSVQQDLADSVDQSKIERTIVYGLPADSAASFSAFGTGERPAASAPTAQLPLLARSADRAPASHPWRAGPMPMDHQAAARVVPAPGATSWWHRPAPSGAPLGWPADQHNGHIFLRGGEPTLLDLLRAERDGR